MIAKSKLLSHISVLGQFAVVYADPPWSFRDRAEAGRRGAAYKYGLLSLDDIRQLNVLRIVAPDAALFLWCPAAMLPEGLSVMAAWGFRYKCVAFHWRKVSLSGQPVWGMGSYTRSNIELCLLGTRGRLKRASGGVHAEVTCPRLQPHSAKPAEVRARIEQLYGDVPRLEMFARGQPPTTIKGSLGWVAIGNEVDGQDIRDALQKIEVDEQCCTVNRVGRKVPEDSDE